MSGQLLAPVVMERSWKITTVGNNTPRYVDLKAHCLAQGSIIWRARVPAAEMAGQLAAGVMERNWVGAGRIANLHTCVNAETKEGAWVGLANKVRQFPGPQIHDDSFKVKFAGMLSGRSACRATVQLAPLAGHAAMCLLQRMPWF